MVRNYVRKLQGGQEGENASWNNHMEMRREKFYRTKVWSAVSAAEERLSSMKFQTRPLNLATRRLWVTLGRAVLLRGH